MKLFKAVLKKKRAAIAVWALICAVDLTVSLLYNVMLEPALYALVISLFVLVCLIVIDYFKEKGRSGARAYSLASILTDWDSLPEAHTPADEDYQAMINVLGTELDRVTAEYGEERQGSLDYYTAWVHQIKTPIAVMKLKLAEDTPENRALKAELFRIEQYVEMVLQYIRLGSGSNDLVIREYDLDELIREAVRKYATQFVEKKLKLEYEPVKQTVVTDGKWFVCILEQLLSNAIKYTPSGAVSITLEDGVLSVSDTGIGIAPEDLPRIFEKGYTGLNGRLGEKSSGLGLYLARKAADLLSIPLSAESVVGQGSRFLLNLGQTQAPRD